MVKMLKTKLNQLSLSYKIQKSKSRDAVSQALSQALSPALSALSRAPALSQAQSLACGQLAD